MDEVRYPVVELRQYTLHPGQRDVLIQLFDREFVESQEALGIALVGQFRDLDNADRFVWLRGFTDMASRAEALRGFYTGPCWRTHGKAANATMVDSDDVLLLRPVAPQFGFPAPQFGFPAPRTARPDVGQDPPASLVTATLHFRDRPFDDAFADFFEQQVRPALVDSGATPLARLQTEYAENTFPALPVRTGEHVFVWFARFDGAEAFHDHLSRLERSNHWQTDVLPQLTALAGPAQRLRLTPTARSLLG
jgi:hypothetical protein